jgi:UDP-glucuronate 4-epimerase
MKRVLITGSAGFIGFHLAELLLQKGLEVLGFDGFTDYYDVELKKHRHQMLKQHNSFSEKTASLEGQDILNDTVRKFAPDVIVHLAAQAGVRYSLENPRAYIDSNIVGTFNIIEAARKQNVKHLLMASTSSVYGANKLMPFCETEKVASPLTLYAATKHANESMGHAYAHLYGLPITMFRFFTVYGPWGRPDMALFKFTENILKDKPIDIFNQGDMYRDFTYVTDLVQAISLLIQKIPNQNLPTSKIDSISDVAPFRVVNIGNSTKVRLLDFIEVIEKQLGIKAKRNYLPMQMGDVPATWADANLLEELTGYRPQTSIEEGVAQFVEWYRNYYKV